MEHMSIPGGGGGGAFFELSKGVDLASLVVLGVGVNPQTTVFNTLFKSWSMNYTN